MVTTKSGTPDKPKYSFKFYQGFKYAYQLHDMMTSSEWLGLLEEEAALGGPKVPSAARLFGKPDGDYRLAERGLA